MRYRSGVVSADELDCDTMESVDFLMAKLKQIQSQKVNPVDVTTINKPKGKSWMCLIKCHVW